MVPTLTRRSFLGLSATAVAGLVLDPERLLWVPGQKTFFLPPERSVVLADVDAVEALMASIGGPIVVGAPVRAGLTSVYMTPDPTSAVRMLTDREYQLLVARGRQLLADRRRVRLSTGWPT